MKELIQFDFKLVFAKNNAQKTIINTERNN